MDTVKGRKHEHLLTLEQLLKCRRRFMLTTSSSRCVESLFVGHAERWRERQLQRKEDFRVQLRRRAYRLHHRVEARCGASPIPSRARHLQQPVRLSGRSWAGAKAGRQSSDVHLICRTSGGVWATVCPKYKLQPWLLQVNCAGPRLPGTRVTAAVFVIVDRSNVGIAACCRHCYGWTSVTRFHQGLPTSPVIPVMIINCLTPSFL